MKAISVAWSATSAVLVVCAGLFSVTPALAEKPVEHFDAEVVPQGNSARRGRIEIQITRFSTPEEKANLSVLMQIEDPKAFVAALDALEPVGFIRFRNASTQPLRFARESVANGERTIVVFTATSLASALADGGSPSNVFGGSSRRRAAASEEFIEIVELKLDSAGKGEGSWATGVRIGVNPDTGAPGILSSKAVTRLRKVRPAG